MSQQWMELCPNTKAHGTQCTSFQIWEERERERERGGGGEGGRERKFVGCLTSQQHASVSQGQICSDNFMCCHTETEVAGQTFHLT